MKTSPPALPLTGSCSCGAIRYEIASFPLLLYTCNCTDCQTASGSAFALNMPVATRSFRIVQGTPKPWRHASPSGVNVTSWSCGECSARLYGEREGRAETINLRAGTLDDTSWLKPVAHLFMQSAQSWVRPAAEAECFERGTNDFPALAARWRAMWPEFFPAKS